MGDFFTKIWNLLESTNVREQVATVDYVALFSNPWFIIPFVLCIGYLLYKQDFRDLIIITAFVAVWWVSGTEYMHTLVVGDTLDITKILPVLFGGAALLGFLIYLLFGRSD
ncbi:MAG TPA: hypothetical protein EYP18_04395 [Desulfobacterales bacterium]|nr:hypothetical protein [Desulfobacterales bacterium]